MVKKTKVKLQEEISPVEMIPQSIRFKAKNQRQKEYYELIKEKEITFCSGAAGVGKSYVSFAIGLELVKNKNNGFKKLIVCTPAVEADEKIGFLPGRIEEKLSPYLASSVDLIDCIVTKQVREDLVHKGIIEFEALGFIRGKTFHDCILVCEEAQNMSPKQMKTLITRIGENAKFIISGDIEQSDRYRNGKESGLSDAIRKFSDIEEIGVFEFSPEDIVRNPIISKMLKKYEVEDVKPKNEFTNTSGDTTTDIFGFKPHQDPSKLEPRSISVVDKPKISNCDDFYGGKPSTPKMLDTIYLDEESNMRCVENKSFLGKLFG